VTLQSNQFAFAPKVLHHEINDKMVIEKRHCDSTSSFTYGNLGVGWLVMRLMTKHCEVSLGAEINRLRSAGCIISEHCAV
jgi:hypothetical protein